MHMESVVSIDSIMSRGVVTVVFDYTLATVKGIFDEAKSFRSLAFQSRMIRFDRSAL